VQDSNGGANLIYNTTIDQGEIWTVNCSGIISAFWEFGFREKWDVLMHKLLKLEIMKSRRAEVVGQVDVTLMDVNPRDLGHVPVDLEGKKNVVGPDCVT
jgi:hypothetical protein